MLIDNQFHLIAAKRNKSLEELLENGDSGTEVEVELYLPPGTEVQLKTHGATICNKRIHLWLDSGECRDAHHHSMHHIHVRTSPPALPSLSGVLTFADRCPTFLILNLATSRERE